MRCVESYLVNEKDDTKGLWRHTSDQTAANVDQAGNLPPHLKRNYAGAFLHGVKVIAILVPEDNQQGERSSILP